jgi:integrase
MTKRKPRRKTFGDTDVAALRPKTTRYAFPDPELPGHYVRVTPNGVKSYVVVAIGLNGKQTWATIGQTSTLSIAEARDKAREEIRAIKSGATRGGAQSFSAVAEQWFKRHVEANKLRSARGIRRNLDKHILPTWGGRDFISIRRGDVAALLDAVEDNAGPVAADMVLAHVSTLCSWYEARHDDYVSPVVRGMRRSKPSERARERILDDGELRTIWTAAAANGLFGAFVRLALLTGQRREKVASMKWSDIAIDGTWTIFAEAREKSNAKELVLPGVALEIIKVQPRFESNPFVFAGRGGSHFSSYSQAKTVFDAAAKIDKPWRLHDLRRTARSLMSRAGVRPDIAERVLGHAIRGVEGVYDRHSYRDEKAHALKALAGLIERIVAGPTDNVVPLTG